MKHLLTSALLISIMSSAIADDSHSFTTVPPKVALERLTNGNRRFYSGRSAHPDQTIAARKATANSQSPYAVVVTCSDSRLSPEILFDQGIGRLFVIRVAGNTVDKVALGSIEYAVANLGARTVLVMGHEHCGAVQACAKGKPLPGSIGAVTEPIEAAVETTKGLSGDHVHLTMLENVRNAVRNIRSESKIVADLEKSGELRVVGGAYSLSTGHANLFKVQ